MLPNVRQVEARLQECGQWPPTSPIKQSASDSSLDDLWSMSRNPTVASFPRQNAQGEIPIDAFCGSDIATRRRLHLNLRQLQISPPTTTPLLPLTPTDDETMQIEPIIKQEPEEKNYEMDEDMCHSVEDWKGSDSPIPVMPKKGSLPLPPLTEGTEEPKESKPEPGASIAMPPALVYIITIRFSRETRGMDRNNGGLTVTMHRHMPGALFICTACSTLFQVRDPSFHDLPDLDPNNVEWSIIKWRRPFMRTGKFIRTSDEEPRHFEWWETTTPRQPSLNRVVIDCPACKFEGKTTLLDVTVKSHERSRLGLTLKRDSPTQSSKPEL